jgi:heme A synthase
MACPDVPLCLGRFLPPLDNAMVALHFGHRALGIVLFGIVLLVGHLAFWRGGTTRIRVLGASMAAVVTAQLLLGFYSVFFRLAVVPVSLHTLLAAILLTLSVALVTLTWAPGPDEAE